MWKHRKRKIKSKKFSLDDWLVEKVIPEHLINLNSILEFFKRERQKRNREKEKSNYP